MNLQNKEHKLAEQCDMKTSSLKSRKHDKSTYMVSQTNNICITKLPLQFTQPTYSEHTHLNIIIWTYSSACPKVLQLRLTQARPFLNSTFTVESSDIFTAFFQFLYCSSCCNWLSRIHLILEYIIQYSWTISITEQYIDKTTPTSKQ